MSKIEQLRLQRDWEASNGNHAEALILNDRINHLKEENAMQQSESNETIETLRAQLVRYRAALENIAVYGCGMLNQPAAMNAPKEVWLEKRIREYERCARAALSQQGGGKTGHDLGLEETSLPPVRTQVANRP